MDVETAAVAFPPKIAQSELMMESESPRSRERLRLALESTGCALWESELSTGQVYVSEEWSRLRGEPPSETLTTFPDLLQLIHPDEREKVHRNQTEVVKGRRPLYEDEMRLATVSGNYLWLGIRGRVVDRDANGRALRMMGIIEDITKRKGAEHRLREYTERLQALSHRLLSIQETERRVLARELHDEIGQALTAVKLNLKAIERTAASAFTAHSVRDGIVVVEQAIEQVRSLSLDLRPTILDDLGLIPALHWYLGRQAERFGLPVTLTAEPLAARSRRPVETACFRVVQEALTNAARHAYAQRVWVDVKQTDGWLCVNIRDDGTGFDVSAAKDRARRGKSAGLLGMEERALLAGGTLQVESIPGGGTTIRAHFRLDGETA
ncbi:PAS domain-containing protein [Paraburkholderia nemoris]|uniref:sensor histidine kinase n=1 Tax=Paraburkholderia nemoris TaxID=2793076 RepID=UPI0038BCEF86